MRPEHAQLPSHAELTILLQRLLPPALGSREVDRIFHTLRHPLYDPTTQRTSRVIISITPTAGFYTQINCDLHRPPPLCFLHRPWALDRARVRRGTHIIASHAAFDENLTVGWNPPLARRLGLNVDDAVCIAGYKNNPDRKIELVARLSSPIGVNALASRIRAEFGVGELHTPWDAGSGETSLDQSEPGAQIRAVAIMNAFHEAEVERAVSAAREQGWISAGPSGAHELVYLTGEAREYGPRAVRKVGVSAVCVGHRACEEWGIRYLAGQIREEWPCLEVVEVLEEEERVERTVA